MRKVLITGHLGFIGRSLKKFLEQRGETVIGLDKIEGNDILTADLPECDIVIHLAAESGVRKSILTPEIYWKVNVDGTRRILSHYSSKRVLVASSSSQYEPYLNPYAASKNIMESIPHNNVCFMRFHTVYSDRPRENMFFYKLLNGTLEYVTAHSRDFIHIDDICNSVLLLMDSKFVGPIDIGTGHSVKICDLAPALPLLTDTPYEREVTKADTAKLSELGYTATIKVEDFIRNNLRR